MARWMTIPQWSGIKPVDLARREQEPPLAESAAPKNVHALVRGTVELPPGTCEIRVCADDRCMLWLDGIYAGQGPAPAYPDQARYDRYPLEGGRQICFALHIYYQGLVNRVWNSGDGRFGVWLSVTQNGQEIAACDETWTCRLLDAYSGEPTGYDTRFLENLDARRWPEGWELPGFPDGDWEHLIPARGLSEPAGKRAIRMLSEFDVPPAETRPIPGGVLLDFGTELAGNLRLIAKGPAGSAVTLRYGEELDEAGRVRWDMRCNCRCEERWTLKEGGNTWHPFDYMAFRYAEVLHPPEVKITEAAARTRCYPLDETLCTLDCPGDQMGEVFQICKNAVRWCSQEGFLDCPGREKGQYLGDAIVTARAQAWLSGSTELLRKCIRDFIASARISPALMAVAPGSFMQEIADYSLLFPLLPLTDYEFTGDRTFLEESFPAVQAIVEAFQRHARPDGLLESVSEAWNMVDWPEGARDGYGFPLTRPIVSPGCHNVINALWYGANLMLERIETILALPVQGRSAQIGAAFRKTFYRPDQALYADSEASAHCSLHANLYPAFFGLCPDADAFTRLALTPGRFCGVFPSYFLLRALAGLGKTDALWQVLAREDGYGWRNMLREGATCAFESWGKELKWNTSLCHAWAAAPVPILIEEIAGMRLEPDAPDGLTFTPHIPDTLPSFTLRVPFQGKTYQIKKAPGEAPRLERIGSYALPEIE